MNQHLNAELARNAIRTPAPAAIHAYTVACQAARQARLAGADDVTCSLIHAETYAYVMAQG